MPRDPIKVTEINLPFFDFRNLGKVVLAKIKEETGKEMEFVNIEHTNFNPDLAPYEYLDIKLAQYAKYTPSQLTLLNDTLLDIKWPTFQEHLYLCKDIT